MFVPLRDCEAACERSGSGVFILLGGVWFLQRYFGDGSRMAVAFWCGAVFFSRFSVDARSQREFGGGFLRVSVGGRRAPYCCRSVWLCSFFFFLYVVFCDYLLVFTPSLSMKMGTILCRFVQKKIKPKKKKIEQNLIYW